MQANGQTNRFFNKEAVQTNVASTIIVSERMQNTVADTTSVSHPEFQCDTMYSEILCQIGRKN